MSSPRTNRYVFLGGGAVLCILLSVAVVVRLSLATLALGFGLQKAGASGVTLNVTEFSPWRVVVENVGFLFQSQTFSAQRVSMERNHWWSSSLGKIRVEQARLPVDVAQLAAKTRTPSAPENTSSTATLPEKLPFEELSIDGRIVLQADGSPEQALIVKLAARQIAEEQWSAQAHMDGPGMGLVASGTFDLGKQQAEFSVPTLTLDLKPLRGFVQQVMPLPEMGDWEVEGRLDGHLAGKFRDGTLDLTGNAQVRDGRLSNSPLAVVAEGVEIDVEFTDLPKLYTKPGAIRVRELRVKDFPLRDISAQVALAGIDKLSIAQLKLTALGGTVTAEPFDYAPASDKLNAVVNVDGISVEEVMAMTKDLPAKAKGRVNGRFPINLDGDGFHLGTGWLELMPGVNAEVAFSAAGLLTAGTSPKSPSYGVLQRIESGLLTLGISELRLDIHPPDAPPGRSATLHLAGAPIDPTVKAPVVLDLNVNGPLEKLLKLGLDSRLKVGSKP